MRQLFCIFLVAIFSTGCFGPLSKNNRAEKKVEKAKTEISNAHEAEVDKSKGYFYGSGYALGQVTNPTPEVKVAKELNEKGMAIIGPPTLREINEFKSIVDGLLSQNEKDKGQAREDLNKKDGQIIELQSKIEVLEKDLVKKEDQRKEIAAENASYANTWVNIKRVFWWIVWGGLAMMGLRVVCAVVPPPYNSIGFVVDYIFGGLSKIIFGVFSKAKDAAGVVGKETYKLTEDALIDIVGAINEVKKEKPDVFNQILRPKLDDHTDKDTTREFIKNLARKV